MRNIELPADRLLDFAIELLRSQGVPSTGARTVARELREADLWGQAGHGFHRLPYYLVELEQGNIKPRGRLRREIDSGLFLRVTSNNFGQVAASEAVDLACQRAEAEGACLMGWRRFHHIGRAGSWVWKVAERGLAAILLVNTEGTPRVRPYGGVSPVFGTSPAAFALPGAQHPEMIDFSAAAMVEGKIRQHKNNRQPLPPGCVIASDGRATRDAAVIYRQRDRGSIRALGGDAAEWKGSALLAAMDLFAGLLTETGYADHVGSGGTPRHANRNGALLIVFRVDTFRSADDLSRDLARYVAHVKSAVRQQPGQEILFPGERGYRLREERLARNVLPLDATVCRKLRQLGRKHAIAWPGAD